MEGQWLIDKKERTCQKNCDTSGWTMGVVHPSCVCVLSRPILLTSLKTKHCIDLTASPPW